MKVKLHLHVAASCIKYALHTWKQEVGMPTKCSTTEISTAEK